MKKHVLNLSDDQFNQLNDEYPPGNGSACVGHRAEEIIKIYFRGKDPQCKFGRPRNGADLTVHFSENTQSLTLEIKGTEDAGIAWDKLKVSSKSSRRMLVEEMIPLYRVTKVFGQNPVIYVLVYCQDFELEPEPRWRIKKKSGKSCQHGPITTNGVLSKKQRSDHGKSSKWKTLTEWLSNKSGREVKLMFSEASGILGFSLPAAARRYRAFWANQSDTTNRPQARAWQEAGFHVESVRLSEEGWVRFKRGAK